MKRFIILVLSTYAVSMLIASSSWAVSIHIGSQSFVAGPVSSRVEFGVSSNRNALVDLSINGKVFQRDVKVFSGMGVKKYSVGFNNSIMRPESQFGYSGSVIICAYEHGGQMSLNVNPEVCMRIDLK